MQRLNSYKERNGGGVGQRSPPARSGHVGLMIPGARQPVIATALLDLPRFKSKPSPVPDVKYFSSDKAKAEVSSQLPVEQFLLHKRETVGEQSQINKKGTNRTDTNQEQLQRIRKSENLSHNKNRSSSDHEIARARRSLHLRDSRSNKDSDGLYIQRSNTKNIKVERCQQQKPISQSLPSQPRSNKETPSKPSLIARYRMYDEEEDEKWSAVERQLVQKDPRARRPTGMGKVTTELSKEEFHETPSRQDTSKMPTEITDSRVRFKRKVESKSKIFRKSIEKQKEQSREQPREEQEEKVNSLEPSRQFEPTVELPYFFIIEDIHLNLYQNLKNNTAVNELCLCYINLEKINNERVVYGLLGDRKQVALLRNLFVFERLIVFAIIYIEKWKAKKRRFGNVLIDLARLAYINYSTLIELVMEILQEHGRLDGKVFQPKELGKDKKFKQITRSNLKIKGLLMQLFESKELPLFELFNNLLDSSLKLESMEFINVVDRTLKWEVLAMPSYPYLPPAVKDFTLVVDLDETLIHYNEKESVVHERAYVGEFLQRMSRLFELVIFTAGTKAYADNIIDSIDPEHHISFRLYRNHITLHEGAPIKDLSKLGREMHRTIIVDNLSSNFRLQPDNGVLISSWYGEESDDVLIKLANVLKNIHGRFQHDLREGVKHWSHYIKEEISYNRLIYEMKEEL